MTIAHTARPYVSRETGSNPDGGLFWWFRHSTGRRNGREVMCVSGTGQAIANHQKIARNNRTFRQMAKAPDTPGPEREFSLFDGPGGAMGIDFFLLALGLIFRASARFPPPVIFGVFRCFFGVFFVILLFFGGVFVLFVFFLLLFRALARFFFVYFPAGLWAKPGIPALRVVILTFENGARSEESWRFMCDDTLVGFDEYNYNCSKNLNEHERWHQNIISLIERSQKMLPIMYLKLTPNHSRLKNIHDLVHFIMILSWYSHGTLNTHICSRHIFWRRMIETKLQVRNRNRIEARFDWCNKKYVSSLG